MHCSFSVSLVSSSSPSSYDHPTHESPHLTRQKRNHSVQQREGPVIAKCRITSNLNNPLTPPAFWDNLPTVYLTKRALRELNRRNVEAAQSPVYPPHQHAHRSVTRKGTAKRRNSCVSVQSTSDFLSTCTATTLKSLKVFSRQGGPDLSDLRSVRTARKHMEGRSRGRAQVQSLAIPASTHTSTDISKSTGVYDRNFRLHLIYNGIYPFGYTHPNDASPTMPSDSDEICRMIDKPRPSISHSTFGNEAYARFWQVDAKASKEKHISELVLPFIEGDIPGTRCRSGGIPFTNLDPLTDGTLKPGNPDVYYGACPELLSRTIRDKLSGKIVPSTQEDLPMVPNLFLAVKGPDGSLDVANRQACYDGALGARGMHSLQSYGQSEPIYDGRVSAITCTYQQGTLRIFTIHINPPRTVGGQPEYYMNLVRGYLLNTSAETFRQGLQAFLNARDWAKEQRDQAIMNANNRERFGDAEALNQDADPDLSSVTAMTGPETGPRTMSHESHTSVKKDTSIAEATGRSAEATIDSIPAKCRNKLSSDLYTRFANDSEYFKRRRTT
ncbi:hypothetical protein BU24DRAFT_394246 [Aaosphaeria arxii CBS 175.79]|uniref:DUF7924 domain-containing protein n=1 Tax=Aaosphaeria arxii CBS 175.79 TaxID=1450172 RepID=A0A6A5XM86_9PLEO|nr:uncharacterized protein BU24DRAFT_394246 [Aaosphaeria arxii CBS 175.79]KAF2013444.1 hypothetical protein BU24DRAFT_394246 [Aaosphaeria arxii CBS 175.79]